MSADSSFLFFVVGSLFLGFGFFLTSEERPQRPK